MELKGHSQVAFGNHTYLLRLNNKPTMLVVKAGEKYDLHEFELSKDSIITPFIYKSKLLVEGILVRYNNDYSRVIMDAGNGMLMYVDQAGSVRLLDSIKNMVIDQVEINKENIILQNSTNGNIYLFYWEKNTYSYAAVYKPSTPD
ncbi:MAG: hypothetical protein SFX18_13395 [Pirellulales bacterium]|nr:hypothetical protein [Pirellulales bacterium]